MSFIQNSHEFTIADVTATHSTLPHGNYILRYEQRKGYFLTKTTDFKLPSKLYGDHGIVNRWLSSWHHNTNKNMGIILSGTKGTGKTITAQHFCIESQLPVIIINEAYAGSDFIEFITNEAIGECIIFIDEFEKVYPRYSGKADASDLLSIMDGNFTTRLVFLLTVNEFDISDYLINRLSRVKYRKDYNNLTDSEMQEVINDMLINKDHTSSIYEFFDTVGIRTYDLLTNLIKEMNLFKEDALSVGAHLNLQPSPKKYTVYELHDGSEFSCYECEYKAKSEFIRIERKSMKYLVEKRIALGLDPTDSEYSEYDEDDDETIPSLTEDSNEQSHPNTIAAAMGWVASLRREDCKIERHGVDSILITHIPSGCAFRLKEATKTYMAF
jgi:broad-specificity NMP kinase